MKRNYAHKLKTILSCILMLAGGYFVQAKSVTIPTSYEYMSSKDEDSDKNITNVKVMYNPVAAQITVNFKLVKQSVVTIKLMDALGNEVLNLSNSTLESGNQSLSFETLDKVSPGFYFVRVASGSETVVKRVSIR